MPYNKTVIASLTNYMHVLGASKCSVGWMPCYYSHLIEEALTGNGESFTHKIVIHVRITLFTHVSKEHKEAHINTTYCKK